VNITPEQYAMICNDIQRLEKTEELTKEEKYKLHREMDAKYQARVDKWYHGLWCTSPNEIGVHYRALREDEASLNENLEMMKFKLQALACQVNDAQMLKNPSANITMTASTNVNISMNFEQARQSIENNSSLSTDEKQEVLDKISELEEVVKSPNSKKSKWEKIKPVLLWLADKSCDVGIAMLPLLFS